MRTKCFVVTTILAVVFTICVLAVCFMVFSEPELPEFVCRDQEGLHWDYEGMLKAYEGCRNSTHQQEILDVMVKSRAVHLVPELIESIPIDGFMDAERIIHAIIDLTGQDFANELDIKRVIREDKVEKVKAKMRRWWEENSSNILSTKGHKSILTPPNHWPSLSLHLRSDKANYFQAEPIRLTVSLQNNGDLDYKFRYTAKRRAFTLEYCQIDPNQASTRITEQIVPLAFVTCRSGFRILEKPRYLTINPEAPYRVQTWLAYDHRVADFPPGTVKLRTILRPLSGPHKDMKLSSNDLEINILTPEGNDANAFAFIMKKGLIELDNGSKYGPGFMDSGLIYNSGSHHGQPVHEYFLRNYGDTIYAPYVKFNMALYLRPSNGQAIKQWLELLNTAPPDFPLLPETCYHLLEYGKRLEKGELENVLRRIKSLPPEKLQLLDLGYRRRLEAFAEDLKTKGDTGVNK